MKKKKEMYSIFFVKKKSTHLRDFKVEKFPKSADTGIIWASQYIIYLQEVSCLLHWGGVEPPTINFLKLTKPTGIGRVSSTQNQNMTNKSACVLRLA